MHKRVTTFIYGAICYLRFFGTFLYAVGFIGSIGLIFPLLAQIEQRNH